VPGPYDFSNPNNANQTSESTPFFVAYSPLGRGFLTARFKTPEDIPEGDYRRTSPRFQGGNFAKNLELAREVERLAAERRVKPSQLALAWVLARGEDIVPIPGTSRRDPPFHPPAYLKWRWLPITKGTGLTGNGPGRHRIHGGNMSSSLNLSAATGATQQTQWNQSNNPFQQLSQALSSGNLAAAQTAFATIQQNAPQGSTSQGAQGTSSQNSRQAAFAALGQALQSGDLAGAQEAFAQLQQTGGHHHHHHESQSATTGTAGDTLDITGNTGTINIIEGSQSGASTNSTSSTAPTATAAAGSTIDITNNSGTINIIA